MPLLVTLFPMFLSLLSVQGPPSVLFDLNLEARATVQLTDGTLESVSFNPNQLEYFWEGIPSDAIVLKTGAQVNIDFSSTSYSKTLFNSVSELKTAHRVYDLTFPVTFWPEAYPIPADVTPTNWGCIPKCATGCRCSSCPDFPPCGG